MFVPHLSRREALRLAIGGLAVTALGACSGGGDAGGARAQSLAIAYGPEPMQQGQLLLPAGRVRRPVVVLVHGGYWAVGFDRSAMAPLAEDLARAGYVVWNIDYRRVGDPGGGWPGTLEDVASAIDHLATLAGEHPLDPDRVVVAGHSAGGQLAFWSAAAPGVSPSPPAIRPVGLISLSGVLDLQSAAELPDVGRLGDLHEAVIAFLDGTPEDRPERYQAASPISLVPLGIPQLLLHGTGDPIVPPSQSQDYATAAAASGDPVSVRLLGEVDHFDTASPDRTWWNAVVRWLPTVVGVPAEISPS